MRKETIEIKQGKTLKAFNFGRMGVKFAFLLIERVAGLTCVFGGKGGCRNGAFLWVIGEGEFERKKKLTNVNILF